MIRAHYDAVKALIPSKWTIYTFNVPDEPTYPYILLWGGIGQESSVNMSGSMDTLTMGPKLTYAGQTGEQLLVMVADVRAALIRALPVVAGWAPSRLGHASLIDVQTDFDVTIPGTKRHPVYAVDEFPFTSQRA